MAKETGVLAGDEPLGVTYLETGGAVPEKAAVPMPILKRRGAINLYYIAVGALAIVVVLIPVLSIWVTFPDQILGGWSICIGGLIAMIGVQSVAQNGQ